MEAGELLAYAYPNERVLWTVMITLYPYVTGLVAGAFIISSLYHVFGVTALKPVARFSLLSAFGFLTFATTPLLLHLGHPERSFNIMFTPNLRSAMAGFGFIYSAYFALVSVELWLVFRPFFVEQARLQGPLRPLYRLATLGVSSIPEGARRLDARVITILAGIGIPAACILHGYVGFIFGAVKANPWWSSALMPVIFLLSAMVSGVAMLIITYWISCKVRRAPVNQECMRSMAAYLWGFLILDVALELLEVGGMAYESTEEWHILAQMMTQKIGYSFLGVQFLLGSLVPLLALGWIILAKKRGRVMEFVVYVSSFLLLLQVLAMRWNVVIGGQMFSKSLRSLHDYHLEWLGREGLLAAILVLMAPLVLIAVLCRWLPVWEETRRPPLMEP